MKENQVNSVTEYLNYLKRYEKYGASENLYFRGQLSRYPNMMPTVARKKEDLQNEVSYYEQNRDRNKTIIQNLAKMQHDGIPTRLLDFTIDPLVALFFATQDFHREDSSIFIFIRPNINANSLEAEFSSFLATQEDKYLPNIVSNFNNSFHKSLSLSEAKEIVSKGLFIQPNTVIDKENRRMLNQKGTFAIPGNAIINNKIAGITPFENDGSYEEIVIPFECHEEIREELKKKGYTRKRLLDEEEITCQYPVISPNATKLINPRKSPFRGSQSKCSVTVVTSKLLTYDEIQKIGYQIALNSESEVVWIWFKREKAPSGVNIEVQHWFKQNLKDFFGNDGKKFGKWLLSEVRQEGYVCQAYYYTHPNLPSKHLTVSEDAVTVNLEIKRSSTHLVICTNLQKGTKLFVTYKINNGSERSLNVTIQGQKTYLCIPDYREGSQITGDITLIVSTLQDDHIRNIYGIDYENLKGNFIHRSEDDSMVSGRKHFSIK